MLRKIRSRRNIVFMHVQYSTSTWYHTTVILTVLYDNYEVRPGLNLQGFPTDYHRTRGVENPAGLALVAPRNETIFVDKHLIIECCWTSWYRSSHSHEGRKQFC